MLSDSQKSRIIQFAKKRTAGNDEFHGMAHLEETAGIAVRLAGAEGADAEACWAAGMLHDICKSGPGDHAAEGAKGAKKFLLDIGCDASFAERVADAIHFHNKEFSDGSLERRILWDADKLPIVSLDGFRDRMVPFWISKLGEAEGMKKSVYEYYFYTARFHTATAKKEVKRHAAEMEKYIRGLGAR